jgi:Beta propeller domain
VQVLGTVALWSGTPIGMNVAGLYLQGERLASVTGSTPYYFSPGPLVTASGAWSGGESRIEIFTTAAPGNPTALWRAQLDGFIVSSRRIGDRLYVVTRYTPGLPAGYSYANTPAAQEANRQLIASTPVDDLLPKVRINGGAAQRFLRASDVYSPPQGARKPLASMTVVTAIDLATPGIVQSLAIAGTVESVYVSSEHLFFASSRYDYRDAYGALLPPDTSTYITDVHQIRLGTQAMSVVGSGSIEGFLGTDADKSSFRMSEYQGRFRAITNNGQWGASVNRLTIMQPSSITPGLLKTVSTLPNAKRPEVLGKPYELLYGTRFVGDRLYAVTFRIVDPLYVVDLADSTDPRITAALTLPGFSDYLHPLANGLLLGFGKDARPAAGVGDGQAAWYQGLQLSLYDVADATNPREMQRVLLGKRGSDSALLRDHHAFSALMNADGTGVLAFPARLNDGLVPNSGSGDSAFYPWKESGLMRFELRGTGPTNASLVQLPSLITHSSSSAVLPTYYTDPAYENGRSIIMRNGTIYTGKGKLWRQDAAGNVFGPY